MKTRTLTVGLLALATLSGAFAAASDDPSAAPAVFGMALEPSQIALPVGGAATVGLYADAMHDLDLTLSASGGQGGVSVALASTAFHVQAAHRNVATFAVKGLAAGNYVVMIRGDDGAGDIKELPLAVRVVANETRPAAASTYNAPRPTWGMKWDPAEMRVQPGHDYEAALLLRGYRAIDVSLSAKSYPGAEVALAQDAAQIAPNETTRVAARIHVDDNATGEIVVYAQAGSPADAERHDARLVLHVVRPTAEEPKPAPTAAPSFWDLLRAYLAQH